MNTFRKGNEFEHRVFGALKNELENDQLGLSPNCARIFRKKAYNSRDRGSRIVTDISIEVSAPDCADPYILWIFECKDYAKTIPASDLEEFHSKLEQIGADNTKGTIVVRGALQRSALSYAKSKKIGVIRLLPDEQIEHLSRFLSVADLTHARKVDFSEFRSALTNQGHRSEREFFAVDGECFVAGWGSLLSMGLSDLRHFTEN